MRRTEARISELKEVTPSEHRGRSPRASGTCQAVTRFLPAAWLLPGRCSYKLSASSPGAQRATTAKVTSRSSPLSARKAKASAAGKQSRKPDLPLGLLTGSLQVRFTCERSRGHLPVSPPHPSASQAPLRAPTAARMFIISL